MLAYYTNSFTVGRINLGDKRVSFKWIWVKLLIQSTMFSFLNFKLRLLSMCWQWPMISALIKTTLPNKNTLIQLIYCSKYTISSLNIIGIIIHNSFTRYKCITNFDSYRLNKTIAFDIQWYFFVCTNYDLGTYNIILYSYWA